MVIVGVPPKEVHPQNTGASGSGENGEGMQTLHGNVGQMVSPIQIDEIASDRGLEP